MRRLATPLVSMVLVVAAAGGAFSQGAPGASQGGLPGAGPLPGGLPGQRAPSPALPPRDRAQAAQTGTARIAGRVLASPANTPLRRAQIALTAPEANIRRLTTTDAEGRYQFDNLPAGRFSLSANKAGYVTLQYGQRRPYEAGTPVSVTDGEVLERIDFTLPQGSVIVARVTDEFGEPLAGVSVQLQRYQYGTDGQRRLTGVPMANPASGLAGTDDRGEIRLYGLMPGEYIVLGSMRTLGVPTGSNPSDSGEGYSPTFYPGALTAEGAEAISVGLGEERSIQMTMLAGKLGRVSGQVLDTEGRPLGGAQLSLITRTGSGMSSSGVGTSRPDGTFTVTGIAPGSHTLQATLRAAGGASQSASASFTSGGDDVTGLQLAMGTGALLSGTVVFDGSAPRSTTTPLRVSAGRADAETVLPFFSTTDPSANGEIDERGRFKLAGVSGRVFVGINAPTGWAVRSITTSGDDITDQPIELSNGNVIDDLRIVLTDRITTVTGQVTDDRGRPQTSYVVVTLPAEEKEPIVAARATRVTRPDTSGRYELKGLRPGRYVAVALEALETGRQFAPEFQARLRQQAKTFTLGEGQSVTLDLPLTTGLD